jgi:HEAT repeat protein
MTEGLDALLSQLSGAERPSRSLSLLGLSDLNRDQTLAFRAAFDTLRPERRLDLVSAMVEQAEANIHLNFHSIFRNLLSDSDGRVRKAAIEGLWEDERASLVSSLSDLLGSDPDEGVRAAAATSLGRFVLMGLLGDIADAPARAAEQSLRDAWQRGSEPVAVRRRVLESLAATNAGDVQRSIETAYYDEDPLMRQSALFAMGRTADGRWARPVILELSSPEPAMRFEAATAAGEMGLHGAVPSLIQRLDDIDSDVRLAAAAALGKIGGRASRQALEALIDSTDEALSQAADDALAELKFNSEPIDAGAAGVGSAAGVALLDGDEDAFYDPDDDAELSDNEEEESEFDLEDELDVDWGDDSGDWEEDEDEDERDLS